MKTYIFTVLIFLSSLSFASLSFASDPEVLRLAELKASNFKKTEKRYLNLASVFRDYGKDAFCEKNKNDKSMLLEIFNEDQRLIKALEKHGPFESNHALALRENSGTELFTFYSYEAMCRMNGPFDRLEQSLASNLMNIIYRTKRHALWLKAYRQRLANQW